jgi:serine/threonine protein kinase
MSLEEIVAVSVPVARALAFAHAEGIVHRDVKPENIFLVQRSQGRWGVKVVDFGIAKTPLSDRLTKMGQTLGSPHFMSPEACRGDDVDHRADIYSYGVLLYMMACGKLPFDDPSLLKVLQLQPAVQATVALGYPAHLVAVIGVIQLACLVLYLVPSTSVLGAVLLTGYLGGAIATHVRLGSPLPTHTLFPIYVALFVWGGLYLREPLLRRLLPLRR